MKADIWRLEQELKSTKEVLTQLEVRKKELEASGLSHTPIVTSSVPGQQSWGASSEPHAPKKKKKGKQKPKRMQTYSQKRDRSTITHTYHTYSTGTVWCLL